MIETNRQDLTTSTSTSLNYIKRIGTPITALASGLGGPVAIVRVSGKDLSFLEKAFGSFPKAGEHGLRKFRSTSLETESKILDEVLLLHFKSPNSFTGEDVIEIQGHGVPALVDKVLKELQSLGCAPALPGEFSFRAVWNDKMTLEDASRLQMLFASEGLGASSASKLLSFSKTHDDKIQKLLSQCLDSILKARGRVEAAIDFSEAEEEQAEDIASANVRIVEVRKKLHHLLNTYEVFTQNSAIPTVVLAGPPNAGKSTLLNVLCGSERAIVSDVAGTTRDYVEVLLKTPAGRSFKLIDTAGIRKLALGSADSARTKDEKLVGHDEIESIGISKGTEIIEGSDVLIWIQDARKIPESADRFKELNSKLKVMELFSHADLVSGSSSKNTHSFTEQESSACDYVFSSIDQICLERESEIDGMEDESLVSQRQKKLLEEIFSELDKSEQCLTGIRPLELVGDHMRETEFLIRQVKGESLSEDYIGEIFSQFCLGK